MSALFDMTAEVRHCGYCGALHIHQPPFRNCPDCRDYLGARMALIERIAQAPPQMRNQLARQAFVRVQGPWRDWNRYHHGTDIALHAEADG